VTGDAALAKTLQEDVLVLQDIGLANLGERRSYLEGRYASLDHPVAREIMRWLAGDYAVSAEMVQTQ
jgi:hyaluronoglucosaminidase